MQIKYGATRIVVLLGNKAIKFGKIRLLRFFLRMMILPFSRYQRERFRTKYGTSFLDAAVNDILFGLLANRKEYNYYTSTRDARVIPTLSSFLWGLVIVQSRGQAVSNKDIEGLNYIDLHPAELATPTQFCQHNGKVLLVDYGNTETVAVLTKSLGRVI